MSLFSSGSLVLTRSDDPNLHLLDERGRRIRAARKNGRVWIFMVPGQIQTVRLVSRLFHPAWAEGSHYGPSRGVLVGKITFFDSNRTHTMTEHLDSPALDGWCEKHSAQSRWTSGDAMLSLGDQDQIDPGVLSIEVLSDETYEDDDL